jgi:hypothetical protein
MISISSRIQSNVLFKYSCFKFCCGFFNPLDSPSSLGNRVRVLFGFNEAQKLEHSSMNSLACVCWYSMSIGGLDPLPIIV